MRQLRHIHHASWKKQEKKGSNESTKKKALSGSGVHEKAKIAFDVGEYFTCSHTHKYISYVSLAFKFFFPSL